MDISDYLRQERGRAARLAERLGVSASLVIQWGNGKPIAIERCPLVEAATEGLVSCEELAPALRWHRLEDPGWPWHSQGRPLIDITRQPAAAAAEEGARDAA